MTRRALGEPPGLQSLATPPWLLERQGGASHLCRFRGSRGRGQAAKQDCGRDVNPRSPPGKPASQVSWTHSTDAETELQREWAGTRSERDRQGNTASGSGSPLSVGLGWSLQGCLDPAEGQRLEGPPPLSCPSSSRRDQSVAGEAPDTGSKREREGQLGGHSRWLALTWVRDPTHYFLTGDLICR